MSYEPPGRSRPLLSVTPGFIGDGVMVPAGDDVPAKAGQTVDGVRVIVSPDANKTVTFMDHHRVPSRKSRRGGTSDFVF